MADLEKSVAIIFEGVDAMGAGVDSATKRVDGVADAVQRASAPMADFTLGIAKFEAALVAGGAAATAFAVKLAGDFDSQFREISTLIDQPAEALEGFRGELLDYGRDSTQSLDQVNGAVYSAISAGLDYTESLDAVRQAEKLAVAGRGDLDQSLTVLVSSLNAYGEGMDEAERYSDLLFQTVRSGQTTLPELGASLSQVTSTAANAGVSFDELLAAIASITAGGAPTGQAVTQVRAAISSLIKPTADATSLAEELGIEFNATALESKGLQGVLEDVERATGGNVEQVARLFSSQEALNGALALSGEGAERFIGNLDDMANSTGATEAAYDKFAGEIENGSQRIQNALQGAFISAGTPLLDEFGGIQEAIAAIFNAIGSSIDDGQLSGFVDQLESMFQGIETTLRDVAENLPAALEQADFSSFFDGIEAVQAAVSELFDGADLSSADGLVSVIETLGLGFEFLSEYTAGAITAIGPFLEQLGELARLVLEIDPEIVAIVGSVGGLALVFNTLAGAVTGVTGVMRAFAGKGGVVATSSGVLKTLVGVMTGPLGLAAATGIVAKGVYDAGETFFGMEGRVAEATKEIRAQNEAIDAGELVWDHATGQWAKAGEAQEDLADRTKRMNQELQDAFNGVSSGSDDLADHAKAVDEVNGKYTDYEAMVESAWKSSQSFNQEQKDIKKELATLFDAALDDIGGLKTGWEEVGDGVYQATSNMDLLRLKQAEIDALFEDGNLGEEAYKELTSRIKDMMEGSDSAAKSQKALAGEVLDSEEAILKARDAVLEQELALEGLASNERIKNMEFTANIAIAGLEADARKVEAIFDTLSTSITSTGETLSSLYGTLGSGDLSRFQEMDLEKTLDEENKRRREAFALQQRLTEAQIDQMKAKTAALQNGDGMIKIDSTGLEPALEMIMWEILEKVQMRANAEGAEFLLGI